MSILTQAQLQGMRSTINNLLPDSAANARTNLTTKCWLSPTNGTTQLSGDPRLNPLPEWHITLPDGTDTMHGDVVTITGKGTYFVLAVFNPMSYSTHVTARAIQLKDSTGTLTYMSSSLVRVRRAGNIIMSNILVHIEAVDPRPFEMTQFPDQASGLTIFDDYTLYTLGGGGTLPDIRNRDQIIDPNETDPFTNTFVVYYVRRVKRWPGSHLEIECDRMATQQTM